jgi:hypothetical protein
VSAIRGERFATGAVTARASDLVAGVVREQSRAKRVARSRWLLHSAVGEVVEAVDIYAPERDHVGDDVVSAMEATRRRPVAGTRFRASGAAS